MRRDAGTRGRTLRSHWRSLPASRHSCCLIAGLTKMRVTSLSSAASLISWLICGLHSDGTTCLPSLATRSSACGFQQLGRCPARLRQLKEDIDIEARLVAGVPAVKAPARRHPHVANQHGSHTFIVHLITQALNKLNPDPDDRSSDADRYASPDSRGHSGERLGANDTAPLENAPIDWALPPIGWVIFCHGVAAKLPALANSASSAITVFFMVTSVELSSSRRHSARADA